MGAGEKSAEAVSRLVNSPMHAGSEMMSKQMRQISLDGAALSRWAAFVGSITSAGRDGPRVIA